MFLTYAEITDLIPPTAKKCIRYRQQRKIFDTTNDLKNVFDTANKTKNIYMIPLATEKINLIPPATEKNYI